MAKYCPEKDTCPYCGASGRCHIHCYYKRRIGEFRNGSVVREEVRVMRVICDSCHHTHAILPDVIIPYARYGTTFIFHVLADHFIHHLSAEKTCEKYSISRNQFYKWLSLWRKHKTLWLGGLRSRETDNISFMKEVTVESDYSDFSSSFIKRFAKSFLQSHRNPANYCQQIFNQRPIPDGTT